MNRSLTLQPDVTRSCVDVVISDDLTVETTEHFELTLQSPGNSAVSLERRSTAVVIQDNDCKFSYFIHTCYFCYLILC